MAQSIPPETKDALIAWLRYYRDLGIYDVYRRDIGLTEEGINITVPHGSKLSLATSGLNVMANKTDALKAIREDLGDCIRCVLHKQGRKQIVFGVGNPTADLMFVGEGPGADEDEKGEPFVGRAGQLLNNMIKARGTGRGQVT